MTLVIGGEGKGIRPLLKKSCDVTLSISMKGQLEFLNAVSASAVVFYENLRQKKNAGYRANPVPDLQD